MRSTQRFWMLGLTSPVIYLVICLVLDRTVLAGRQAGLWPLSEHVYGRLFGGLAFLAIVAVPTVYFLKARWVLAAVGETDEPSSILENARGRRFLVLFMICDTVALIGLILFLIQGRLGAMLFFGILGLLNYAAACPGLRDSDEAE